MLIADDIKFLLKRFGIGEQLVLEVCSSPSSTWVATGLNPPHGHEIEVVVKEFRDGARYLAILYREGKGEKWIEYFLPLPPVVISGAIPYNTLADLCQRFGLSFTLPSGPKHLLAGDVFHTASWTNVEGAVRARDRCHGLFIASHPIGNGKVCVDLGFHIDVRHVEESFDYPLRASGRRPKRPK